MQTQIPTCLDELTTEWLAGALRTRFPKAAIQSATISDVIHGSGTKVRLKVRASGAEVPETMIVKAGFEPHSGLMKASHLNEMRAYRDVLPWVRVNAPACYFAGSDADGRTMLILEDLRNKVEFLDLLSPISFDTAVQFIRQLAGLHAKWWGRIETGKEADGFDWVPRPVEGRFFDLMERLTAPETFGRYSSAPRGAATPVCLKDAERIKKGLVALRESYDGQVRVIVHGDTHLGNLYVTAKGEAGFYDWSLRCAPFQHELTYFLVGALDVPDRRRWERELLRIYLEQLASHGITPPEFDAALEAYRREVLWGFFIWLTNSSDYQTESANTAATARFAMAMLDHDTFQALSV